MNESMSVLVYFSRVLSIVNKMKINGKEIDDFRMMEKNLHSLTPKFEHMVVVIEEDKDLSTMIMDHLMGTLQVHEHRLSKKSSLEQALQCKLSSEDVKEECHIAIIQGG